MGEDLPDEWPDLDPVKWYCIHLDDFVGANCTIYVGSVNCCKTGAQIKLWIDGDHDCTIPDQLCFGAPLSNQRLRSIVGPYDTKALCDAAC